MSAPRHTTRPSGHEGVLDVLGGLGSVLGVLVLFGALWLLLTSGSAFGFTLVLLGVGLVYGWLLFSYLEYRRGRRGELLYLLAAAAESGAPLSSAVRAYLAERPHGLLRDVFVVVPMSVLVPGYLWLWHRRFDERVEALAYRLEGGESLTEALRALPIVVSHEGQLAAEVGEVTGQLGKCLRRTVAGQQAMAWVEPVVRVLYTLGLVLITCLVTLFWATVVLPRVQRILSDLNMPLPAFTEHLGRWTGVLGILAFLLGVAEFVGLALLNRTLRWYCPLVGHLYRLHLQGRLSRALGLTLEAGLPAPTALAMFADSPTFPDPMRSHLEEVRLLVEGGEALGPSLRRRGLLPAALVPLTQAAERAHNLPPTLRALGDHLSVRAERLLRRASQLIFPAGILAVGALVGFVVLGMFLPLIRIIEGMSE